jgi:hypothetical protein
VENCASASPKLIPHRRAVLHSLQAGDQHRHEDADDRRPGPQLARVKERVDFDRAGALGDENNTNREQDLEQEERVWILEIANGEFVHD